METSIEAERPGGMVLAFRRPLGRDALASEAARRVGETGYARFAARQRATGVPIPSAVRYLKMQIEFAAERLRALDRLPENFRADMYWPE